MKRLKRKVEQTPRPQKTKRTRPSKTSTDDAHKIADQNSALNQPLGATALSMVLAHHASRLTARSNFSDAVSMGSQHHDDTDVSESPANSTPNLNKKGVLYQLNCLDKKSGAQISRFSRVPFQGIPSVHPAYIPIASGEAVISVNSLSGRHLVSPERKNQNISDFWKNDPEEFVVGKHFKTDTHDASFVRITSRVLLSVIRGLIRYYPMSNIHITQSLNGMVEFTRPYYEIFLYRESLMEILNQSRDREKGEIVIENPLGKASGPDVRIECTPVTHDHLNTLLTLPDIIDEWESFVRHELDRNKRGLVSFNEMWLMFKPGGIVFVKHNDASKDVSGYIVLDKWDLHLWNLSYDNGRLRRQPIVLKIYRYSGEKAITDLPAFPTQYADDQESVRASMIERGKRYYRIMSHDLCHMRYNGVVVSNKPYYYRGEIIVDHRGFKHRSRVDQNGNQAASVEIPEVGDFGGGPLFSKFNGMKCSVGTELEPDQYLLLPATIHGFALEKREWATFHMDFVTDITLEDDPMKHLVIDDDKQSLIEAVAGRPREGLALKAWMVDWDADFVEGKGRGRVLFLHGPPGTGKTLTVELIAKRTRRPLLRLSVADLGTKEVEMETLLTKWLDSASGWGAIVLIDEAEIYLEQRKSGDIGRNALVSAFLRTLEYFPGLLFLTSNGIGLIDEAVMSRIHLAVGYRRPSASQRRRIWYELFDKLEDDQSEAVPPLSRAGTGDMERGVGNSRTDPSIVAMRSASDVVDKEEYASMPLNGRDIRNLLLSAINLARYDSFVPGCPAPKQIKITARHLETVLKNKKQFHDDFKLATGSSQEALAAEQFRRGEAAHDNDRD